MCKVTSSSLVKKNYLIRLALPGPFLTPKLLWAWRYGKQSMWHSHLQCCTPSPTYIYRLSGGQCSYPYVCKPVLFCSLCQMFVYMFRIHGCCVARHISVWTDNKVLYHIISYHIISNFFKHIFGHRSNIFCPKSTGLELVQTNYRFPVFTTRYTVLFSDQIQTCNLASCNNNRTQISLVHRHNLTSQGSIPHV